MRTVKKEIEKLLKKLDAELIEVEEEYYRDDQLFFMELGLGIYEPMKGKSVAVRFNNLEKALEHIEEVEEIVEYFKNHRQVRKNCYTCKHYADHQNGECEGCLGDTEPYEYNNYERGSWIDKILASERSGKRNIVLGHEGEHEVNVKWDIDKTYKKLSHTSECCGGVTTRKNNSIFVYKCYGPAYRLVYNSKGKLSHILELPEGKRGRMWWTAEAVDVRKLAEGLALKEAYNYAETLPYEDELWIDGEEFMVGEVQFLLEMLK